MGTIRDVARHAGVSPTTVSRYFNGRIRLPVRTAARIERAIAALEYRPTAAAQHLASGRTLTIGLVVPRVRSLIFTDFVAGVEHVAERQGYGLMMISTRDDREREIAALHRLRDRHVDGLITLTASEPDGAFSEMLSRHGRVVLACEDCSAHVAPLVTFANAEGAYAATRSLIEAGHRCIVHLGGPAGLRRVQQRLSGFYSALEEVGLSVESWAVRLGLQTREAAYRGLSDLLGSGRRFTAVFAASDEATIGAMQAFAAAGLSVPRDVSLVGFCGRQVSELMLPVVTAARKPVEAMGQASCEALLSILRGETPDPVIRVPVEVVSGQTVGPPPPLARQADLANRWPYASPEPGGTWEDGVRAGP